MWRRMLISSFLAYVAATAAGVVGILGWTRDMETLEVGLLMPLWAIPAIAGYGIASRWNQHHWLRHVAFAVLFLPLLLLFLSVVLFPTPQARKDAADEWALAFSIPYVCSGCAAYVVLICRDPICREWLQETLGTPDSLRDNGY